MPKSDPNKDLELIVRQAEPDLLTGMKPAQKEKLLHALPQIATLIVGQQSFYSGPVPPAEMLAEYAKAIPEGGDRLFKLVESQSAHRHDIERTVIQGQLEQSSRGQIFAFVLALVLAALGTVAFLTGHDGVSGVVFGTTVIGLATVFIVGKTAQNSQLAQKRPPPK